MENMDLETGVADSIQSSIKSLFKHGKANKRRSSPSCLKVSRILRNVNPPCFGPRVVSIGPLHKLNSNVQAFQKQKAIYMVRLINRISENNTNSQNVGQEIMKSCLEKVYSSMKDIKAFYDWSDQKTKYTDAEIAEIMVMDACFILEFIYKLFIENSSSRFLAIKLPYDLVLLENQIPLFVLNDIFQCTLLEFMPTSTSVIQYIRPLINFLRRVDANKEIDHIPIKTAKHILDVLHQCYRPSAETLNLLSKQESINLTSKRLNISPKSIPSVVDLDRAGLSLKPSRNTSRDPPQNPSWDLPQNPSWNLRMEVKIHKCLGVFWPWCKATLIMPVLTIDDSTELILWNLIAYEQLCAGDQLGDDSNQYFQYFTSYAFAMDALVNTADDIAKLVDSGVLVNMMGSNKQAATMINSLCKNVESRSYFHYTEDWNKLNEYCALYWPKHIAKMKSTYFSNPWSIIALFAAILLFGLTICQTIYAIKSA